MNVNIVEFQRPSAVFKTAREILYDLEIGILGSVIDKRLSPIIRKKLLDSLEHQAMIRGLPHWVVRDYIKNVGVDLSNNLDGKINVNFPMGWIESVDKFLKVYVCSKCGFTIPGRPHPVQECESLLVQSVMEL
jgi:hypothetical protein